MDEVLLNKAAIIKRCLSRIREEYDGDTEGFKQNVTKQDSVILNLQRACEAAIDMGNRVIKVQQLGIPQSSRDVFKLLDQNALIDALISVRMQKMVGLRNIAIHDYQALNLDIVIAVIEQHLNDFERYAAMLLGSTSPG